MHDRLRALRRAAPLLAAAAVLLGACARASQTAPACSPVSPKVVAEAGIPVYSGCEVDVAVGEIRPPIINFWTPSRIGAIGCFHVAVELVVDANGRVIPETEHVVVNSDLNFLNAVLSIIPRLQFTPAVKGTDRVAQLIRVDKKSRIESWVRSATGAAYPVFSDYPNC